MLKMLKNGQDMFEVVLNGEHFATISVSDATGGLFVQVDGGKCMRVSVHTNDGLNLHIDAA